MKAKPAKHPGKIVLELGRRDESLLAAASAGQPVSRSWQLSLSFGWKERAT